MQTWKLEVIHLHRSQLGSGAIESVAICCLAVLCLLFASHYGVCGAPCSANALLLVPSCFHRGTCCQAFGPGGRHHQRDPRTFDSGIACKVIM